MERSLSILDMPGSEDFDFADPKIRTVIRTGIGNKSDIRRKAAAVLDDSTGHDRDLLFTTEGIMPVIKEKVKKAVLYDDVTVSTEKELIILHQPYVNHSVNMQKLIDLILELRTRPFAEVKKAKEQEIRKE
jgi:hypothetical protein